MVLTVIINGDTRIAAGLLPFELCEHCKGVSIFGQVSWFHALIQDNTDDSAWLLAQTFSPVRDVYLSLLRMCCNRYVQKICTTQRWTYLIQFFGMICVYNIKLRIACWYTGAGFIVNPHVVLGVHWGGLQRSALTAHMRAFSTIYSRLVIDSFWGVSTLGRPSEIGGRRFFFSCRGSLAKKFHAEDLVRGQENTTVGPIDRARQAWSPEPKISFSGAGTDHGPQIRIGFIFDLWTTLGEERGQLELAEDSAEYMRVPSTGWDEWLLIKTFSELPPYPPSIIR